MSELPKNAQELVELAEANGWTVETEWDLEVRGATEAVSLAFHRRLPSGRSFVWLVRFARAARSGRWQALQQDGHRVEGSLLPGNGSSRDQVASLLGAPLESRLWRSIKNLRWWLAHPDRVLTLDWVGEEEAA